MTAADTLDREGQDKPGRDQVATAIHESLCSWDSTAFMEVEWPDSATADIMRALVKIGALPKECDPEHFE
jgi:hypothetical protein